MVLLYNCYPRVFTTATTTINTEERKEDISTCKNLKQLTSQNRLFLESLGFKVFVKQQAKEK